jgi:ribosomal protein S17E
MGRIKSTLIKRTAVSLSKIGTRFDNTFGTNKGILGSSMPSKRMRNQIAGYITRLKRNEEKKQRRFKEVQ